MINIWKYGWNFFFLIFYYGAERHSDGKTSLTFQKSQFLIGSSVPKVNLSKENLPFMRERKERVRREFVLVK